MCYEYKVKKFKGYGAVKTVKIFLTSLYIPQIFFHKSAKGKLLEQDY